RQSQWRLPWPASASPFPSSSVQASCSPTLFALPSSVSRRASDAPVEAPRGSQLLGKMIRRRRRAHGSVARVTTVPARCPQRRALRVQHAAPPRYSWTPASGSPRVMLAPFHPLPPLHPLHPLHPLYPLHARIL